MPDRLQSAMPIATRCIMRSASRGANQVRLGRGVGCADAAVSCDPNERPA